MKRVSAYRPIIEARLRDFIDRKQKQAASEWQKDFLARLLPFATGGKLLRGSLLCFSYEVFSGRTATGSVSVLNAAMALELTQSGLLIHDDIMDNDDLRRGRPSIHRQYQLASPKNNTSGSSRFGTNIALCAGDTCLFMAFELLSRPIAKPSLDRLFSEYMQQTCFGQMQDVYFESSAWSPSKREIRQMMRDKTAAYSIALPLMMGACLAKRPPEALGRLREFGIAAGTIFQIRDDELGVIGDPKKTGKPAGADIREGKKTLLHYYLMRACSISERRRLRTIFGNNECGEPDITYVQKLIDQYCIRQSLNNDIDTLSDEASAALNQLKLSDKARAAFQELIIFCGSRAT